MGAINAANNLIFNCSIMEEKKKMIFNNRVGKTEDMVIRGNKKEICTITETEERIYSQSRRTSFWERG